MCWEPRGVVRIAKGGRVGAGAGGPITLRRWVRVVIIRVNSVGLIYAGSVVAEPFEDQSVVRSNVLESISFGPNADRDAGGAVGATGSEACAADVVRPDVDGHFVCRA